MADRLGRGSVHRLPAGGVPPRAGDLPPGAPEPDAGLAGRAPGELRTPQVPVLITASSSRAGQLPGDHVPEAGNAPMMQMRRRWESR